MDEVLRRSRIKNPERYAPNGEPLINYAGSSWATRLESWRLRHARSAA